MRGLLNEQTKTVHKLDEDMTELTQCGLLNNSPDRITSIVDVGDAVNNGGANECNRCFSEAEVQGFEEPDPMNLETPH